MVIQIVTKNKQVLNLHVYLQYNESVTKLHVGQLKVESQLNNGGAQISSEMFNLSCFAPYTVFKCLCN